VPQYFTAATPGQYNISGAISVVGDTKFSHDRGFYDAPFYLTITTKTAGATIRYTTDGSAPSPTRGKQYSGPIYINTTTCLRAVAVKPGWMPSNVDAQTYIFLDQVLRQPRNPAGFPSSWGGSAADYEMDPEIVNDYRYGPNLKGDLLSLPSMSLVMEVEDIFGSSGIYSNPHSSGVAWERPGSVELIYPDGTEGFHVNCGVRIYGGVGRREAKKTLRLIFKRQYGPTWLRYPLFGDDAADEFNTIILRANFNDAYVWGGADSQYIRDEFIRRLQLAMGGPAPWGDFVHLYVNGLYWGLYNPTERPDTAFSATYYGGDKEDWDGINSTRPVGESQMTAWNTLMNMVGQGMETNEGYQRLQGNKPDGTNDPNYEDYLDIENYIIFLLANYYGGNNDWVSHNWYAGRLRGHESTGWKSYTWDAEWVAGMRSGLTDNAVNDTTSSGYLLKPYTYLRSNAEFRMLFADIAHKVFFYGGPLYVDPSHPGWESGHPERNRPAALYAELADLVERAMICESARWGDVQSASPYNIQQWRSERDWVLNTYAPQRSGIVLDQLRNANLYPNIDAPVFYVNGEPQHGGQASSGDGLVMANPNGAGTVYYTVDGNDARLPVIVETSGMTLLAEDAAKRVLIPTSDIGGTWRGGNEPYDDSSWNGATFVPGRPGGVGYDENPNYDPYISYNVEATMNEQYTSAYIRIPFIVSAEDVASFNFMTLKMRYDDGFVAYLNGTEVARRNFSGTPRWNSNASGGHDDSAAVMFENVDITNSLGRLKPGQNLLAVHGLNVSMTSSDFLISAEVVAGESKFTGEVLSDSAIEYSSPLTLTKSTHVRSRVLSGSTWSALNEATFAVGPVAENLRITELMYRPRYTGDPNDPNTEFIELKNIGDEALNLNLVKFTNGVDFIFPDVELLPDQYVLVVKDVDAFAAKYGVGYNMAGEYTGSLNNNGERVELQDAAGRTIHNFRYRDGWYDITDGLGFSLTVRDPANTDPNQWGDKATWRPSANIDGSPGADDTGQIPELGDVVINELLAHSHAEASDWVELHNTTDHTINISGWFLSDDGSNLKKYEIAQGRTIRAGGYIVFTEELHFGNLPDPGCHVPFAFSENGETVYLHSGQDGIMAGYSEQEKFGPSETGVAFGRYQKSTGAYNFVAMSINTPGTANAYPKVGPVVITEIMYHPAGVADAEYVELLNISDSEVILYNFITEEPWRFTDDPDNPGMEFLYPSDPPVVMASGEYILMVKDLAIFSSKFPAPEGTQIFAWGAGRLDNGGEKVQISMPGDVDAEGVRQYIRVDRVRYSDGSHPDDFASGVDPWPTWADGLGMSLSRLSPQYYGNDPNNWHAATPSPGKANP
ncbi:MAG: lamin tail domain-containing protein, partial [Phycisphaerales bacterium]